MTKTLIEALEEMQKHGSVSTNLYLAWDDVRAIIEQYKTEGAVPPGYALVPIKPTRDMERVFREEDWEWRDVLAAAESITEEDYNGIQEDELAPAIVGELVKALEEAKPAIAHFSDYWHDLNERDKADKYNTMLSDIAALLARAKAMTE